MTGRGQRRRTVGCIDIRNLERLRNRVSSGLEHSPGNDQVTSLCRLRYHTKLVNHGETCEFAQLRLRELFLWPWRCRPLFQVRADRNKVDPERLYPRLK